jgi:hypothetical protein
MFTLDQFKYFTMNDDMQKQFIGWLAQKLEAKDEQDLKGKMQQLGQDGIKQAYSQFMQEQSQASQGVPTQMTGGKLNYLNCLKAFKKGGAVAMKDCGCGTKEMKSGGRMDKNEKAPTKDYMGQRKDGKAAMPTKSGERMDKNKQDKSPGKKDSMTKGGKKDWISAKTEVSKGKTQWTTGVQKLGKHQQGGSLQAPLMVQKQDGSIGQWGNAIPANPGLSYQLAPSEVSNVHTVPQAHIEHLRKIVPGFDKAVGQPMILPGQVGRYSPEQSDMIRNLITKYPMQSASQPVTGQSLVSN